MERYLARINGLPELKLAKASDSGLRVSSAL